ncbi:hypothetical protein HYV71_02805 [Candidatus Uhrbacteria bacterium]|nr:hypothetical protein [Candidatus Uhrbacteria bacterium]
MQKTRPRLFIASGLTMALKWNAEDDEQKKIMIANNAIKLDFLNKLFDIFFANDFSLVEYIVPQDTLKVPDDKFLSLWKPIERKYPKEIVEIRFQLTKFLYPKQFNAKNYEALTDLQKEKLTEVDATDAFKYAIGHLFALGDINFEGNYIHGPYGYASIGGEAETFFNSVRDLSSDLLKDFGELLFDREVIVFQNYRIVLKNKYKVPPPYNGMFRDKEYLEVTYENNKDLSFYDEQEKLKDQMQYVYDHLISRDDYQQFWRSYRNRYFNLKARYKEAYAINPDW